MQKESPEYINELFKKFIGRKVLVIGDIMLDSYLWGQVDRISPEAPVPIVHVRKREHRLGGAANVAMNLAGLGAKPTISAIRGNDMEGDMLEELLKDAGVGHEGIVISNERPTTVKTRVIGNKNQLLRVDSEEKDPLSKTEQKAMVDKIMAILPGMELVIFEDYDKGAITEELIEMVTAEALKRNIPIVVDPKKRNFHFYKNATLFKPNLRELADGLKLDINSLSPEEEIESASKELLRQLNAKYIMVTLSERGIFITDAKEGKMLPAHIRNIYDVSGAGDTVVSVAGLALLAGANMETLASLANLAGGLVCEKVGVVPINGKELREAAIEEFC